MFLEMFVILKNVLLNVCIVFITFYISFSYISA